METCIAFSLVSQLLIGSGVSKLTKQNTSAAYAL